MSLGSGAVGGVVVTTGVCVRVLFGSPSSFAIGVVCSSVSFDLPSICFLCPGSNTLDGGLLGTGVSVGWLCCGVGVVVVTFRFDCGGLSRGRDWNWGVMERPNSPPLLQNPVWLGSWRGLIVKSRCGI